MHKLLFTLLVIVLSTITATTYAGDDSELTRLLKNMHSMQADFTQNITDNKGKPIQKSTGHMDLQRPNQFRWDMRSPNQQLIITNGKRLWIYDPELEQVTIRKLVTAAGETPAMLLSDENLSLGDEFTVQPVDSTSSMQWFLLIPKDKHSMIAFLKLGFEHQQLRNMQLQDHLGHTTMIEFSNVVLNKPLSSTKFNFNPPANIDIIDETKH